MISTNIVQRLSYISYKEKFAAIVSLCIYANNFPSMISYESCTSVECMCFSGLGHPKEKQQHDDRLMIKIP